MNRCCSYGSGGCPALVPLRSWTAAAALSALPPTDLLRSLGRCRRLACDVLLLLLLRHQHSLACPLQRRVGSIVLLASHFADLSVTQVFACAIATQPNNYFNDKTTLKK
jgi:hypothetical protein